MAHDWTTKQAKRQGLPAMSQTMMEILYKLRDARQGNPFIPLEGYHARTLRTLCERDWMIESPGLDGIRYRITGRGLKALSVYEQPSHRFDGICPQCGVRPKMTYSSGVQAGYYQECIQMRQNRAYTVKGNQLNPDGMCAKCGKRQRHTYPSGHTIAYCAKCRQKMRKQERKRKHKRLLKRIKQGEFIPCIRCGEEPRYHNSKTVYDYCHACYREYHNEYLHKWKLRKALEKNGIETQI